MQQLTLNLKLKPCVLAIYQHKSLHTCINKQTESKFWMLVLTFSDPENVKEHYSHLVGDGVDVLVADISKFHEGGGLGISLEGTQNPHGKIFFRNQV